jgi:hypothetical protein
MTTSSPSRTWVAAGILLIVATLLPLVLRTAAPMNPIPGADIFDVLLFAVALGLFALGRPGVTARRPLGTIALLALAVWSVGAMVVWSVAAVPLAQSSGMLTSIVDDVVRLALAIVAVVEIARAGVVPRPWHRAPLWALVAVAVPQIVVFGLTVSPNTAQTGIDLLPVSIATTLIAPVFLGVLAIVLGVRPLAAGGGSGESIYQGRAGADPADAADAEQPATPRA